jgi:hypothetical protein
VHPRHSSHVDSRPPCNSWDSFWQAGAAETPTTMAPQHACWGKASTAQCAVLSHSGGRSRPRKSGKGEEHSLIPGTLRSPTISTWTAWNRGRQECPHPPKQVSQRNAMDSPRAPSVQSTARRAKTPVRRRSQQPLLRCCTCKSAWLGGPSPPPRGPATATHIVVVRFREPAQLHLEVIGLHSQRPAHLAEAWAPGSGSRHERLHKGEGGGTISNTVQPCSSEKKRTYEGSRPSEREARPGDSRHNPPTLCYNRHSPTVRL